MATAQTFDAVMICNGHYWDPVKPDIPGLEKFKGTVVHSRDYRTFHPYVGKRVVVVGCSHSGGDTSINLYNIILLSFDNLPDNVGYPNIQSTWNKFSNLVWMRTVILF